jgi:hypothetical protein
MAVRIILAVALQSPSFFCFFKSYQQQYTPPPGDTYTTHHSHSDLDSSSGLEQAARQQDQGHAMA